MVFLYEHNKRPIEKVEEIRPGEIIFLHYINNNILVYELFFSVGHQGKSND